MAFKIERFISPLKLEGDPKKPKDTKKTKTKAKGTRFPAGYYNVPNAKPYKMNSDGSVQMATTKGSTYSLKLGTDR
jgi:hypothetical protein